MPCNDERSQMACARRDVESDVYGRGRTASESADRATACVPTVAGIVAEQEPGNRSASSVDREDVVPDVSDAQERHQTRL